MSLLRISCLLFFFFTLYYSPKCFAYPEMLRHGYNNCTSCHVSPTGGGVLTPYGRNLSKEILSQFGTEAETRFVNWTTPPENLNLGGDLRVLQQYMDTPFARSAELFVMQADVEGSYTFKNLTFDATLGYVDSKYPYQQHFAKVLVSRRHYLLYQTTDELAVRAGRFLYSFGINHPNHYVSTKQGLNIHNQGSETYNIEASWLKENFNFYLTGLTSRPDIPTTLREKGIALNTAWTFGTLGGSQSSSVSGSGSSTSQNYRLGLSYLYANQETGHRHVLGPYGILCFTPKFFLLSELYFQKMEPLWGLANYERLSYEWTQGFLGFLTLSTKKSDFSKSSSLTRTFGMGIQYFPRPHFEIELQWQLQVAFTPISPASFYSDRAFLMMHIYL